MCENFVLIAASLSEIHAIKIRVFTAIMMLAKTIDDRHSGGIAWHKCAKLSY
jgi:hypothetical protein